MSNKDIDREFDIAIVGMSGRFPEASNIKEYWENLKEGRECFTRLSDEQIKASGVDPEIIKDPNYIKVSPVLKDYDKFDARFFGYTPREVSMMDPQQRLFLECCWEAFEDAGYNPHAYDEPVGVFGGSAINSYMVFSGVHNRFYSEFLPSVVGNDNSFLANRVSYQLNLSGPAVTVQTACSTSLVSVHLSVQSLLSGECSMALAGGVAVWVPHEAGHLHKEGSVFTKDGHCRAFDSKATGTIFGSGAGVVLLKRFDEAKADGDTIYAVIKGSAVNNDGAKKTDYTAPSVDGQAEVIVEALANSGLSADDISYVETHGTGTFIGDPIEIRALTKAYRAFTNRKQFCKIGSVKPNIGHLDAAAGVSGLIKTVLAMNHKMIPPSINFDEPNPAIDFENSPFSVNDKLTPWESADGNPLRAGVTSLGMGGTNAHIILEEAPPVERPAVKEEWPLLLTYSAKNPEALDDYSGKLADFLRENPDTELPNVAYTLQKGRKDFTHKRYLVAENREHAVDMLENLPRASVKTYSDHEENREVVFLFPGQGSQYVKMSRDLYNKNNVFRTYLDRCAEILRPVMKLDIRHLLFPDEGNEEQASVQLKNTVNTQPVIFSIEYSLAMYWMDMGVNPVAVLGHSLGEFTAACIAGVFDLETGLKLVAKRGSIMQELETGSMLAVMLPPDEVEEYLNPRLSIAGINTPTSCIVSGDHEAVEALKQIFKEKDVYTRVLATSHAFHSHMMDPVLESFREFASSMDYKSPEIPIISTVRGDWASAEEVISPDYWVENIRNPVKFAEGVAKLFDKPEWIMLEVGPGNTLTTLAKQHPEISPKQVLLQSLRHPKLEENDNVFALNTFARLWSCGYPVNWDVLYRNNPAYKIPLPTYAFQRIRCWIDPVVSASDMSKDDGSLDSQEDTFSENGSTKKDIKAEMREIWQEFLGIEDIKDDDDFFELGGNSLVAVQLFDELKYKLGVQLPLSALFEAPTIKEITKLIEPDVRINEESKNERSDVLVKIQSEGKEPPFFCIHGHFGNVMFLRDLAMKLGKDRPFYGIQSVGLAGNEEPLTSIDEMADRYIREMKAIQPNGPYHFGGYCYGTMVSRAIAKKLDDMGEQYAPPIMIDPQPNAYRKVLKNSVINAFRKAANNQRIEVHQSNLKDNNIKKKIGYLFEKSKTRIINAVKSKLLFGLVELRKWINIPMPVILQEVELCNMFAHKRYSKKLDNNFSSEVELIISKPLTEKFSEDPEKDWSGFTKGKMNVHLIEDDGIIMSGVMFDEPYVGGLANVMKDIMTSKPDADTIEKPINGKKMPDRKKSKKPLIAST